MVGAAMVIAGAWLVHWSGCTVTPENYERLRFFFDGVPDPSASAHAGEAPGAAIPGVKLVQHAPYAQEYCGDCHTKSLRMTRNDSGMCMKCHENADSGHAVMHGPVAARACLWCHHPHESPFPKLLRTSDRALCTQCHTPEILNTSRTPEHGDAARGCLECHAGHGGSERFMLRADRALPAPPTGGK